MSINERQYMRSNEDDTARVRPGSPKPRTRSKNGKSGGGYDFTRSEQFGVVLAGTVIVALLLAAIL